MEKYESKYYDYQTKARGLLDADALLKNFEKLSRWYGCRLKKYMPSEKNAYCLDVPCGYGNFLYFLKNNGYLNAIGYDLDAKQIDLAMLVGLPAEVGDVFEVLQNDNLSYDLISSLDFIEHLSKEDALKYLELCFDRLNSGGTLILRTPCADGPFGSHDICNDLTHKWGMTSNLFSAVLEMSGYSEVEILDERPQPTSLVDTIRWLIYFPVKVLAKLACMALGMRSPEVWTRSMIAIARKA